MIYIKKEELLEYLEKVLGDEVQVKFRAVSDVKFIFDTSNSVPVDRIEIENDEIVISNLGKLDLTKRS